MVKRIVIPLLLVTLTLEVIQGKGEKKHIDRRTKEEAQATSIVEQPYYTHQAFRFGYDVKDQKHGHQYRQEEGNHKGIVKGRYGYKDPFGLYREVEYIADALGFRARVRSNEPGLGNQHPAHVDIIKTGHPPPVILHSHPIIRFAHSKPSVVAVRAPDSIVAKATGNSVRLSTAESSRVIKPASSQEDESGKNSRAYGKSLGHQRQSESRKMAVIFTDPLIVQKSNKEPTKSKFWFESLRLPQKTQQRAKESKSKSDAKSNVEKVRIVKVEASPLQFPYFLPHVQKHREFDVLSHPPPKTLSYAQEDIMLFANPSKQQNPYSDTIVIVEAAPSSQSQQKNGERARPKYSGFDIPYVVLKDPSVEPVPSSEFLPSLGPKQLKPQIPNDPFVIVKGAQLGGRDQISESSSNHVQPIAIVFEKDENSPVYESDKLKCQYNCDIRTGYGMPSEKREIVHQPQYVQLPCNLAH